MWKPILVVAAASGLAFAATAARTAEDLAAAVKERRQLMKKQVSPAAKLGGQMVKGKVPFDAGKAAEVMKEIRAVPDKFVTLFPEGTELGAVPDSEALPAIWQSFDEFKALAAKLKDASAEAAVAAGEGSEEFAAAFGGMTKICKECHETYREKRQ